MHRFNTFCCFIDTSVDVKPYLQLYTVYIYFSDMYVSEHENVTILYADVVKYAQLTVRLPVKQLVETLNELFGRFDEASTVCNFTITFFLITWYLKVFSNHENVIKVSVKITR